MTAAEVLALPVLVPAWRDAVVNGRQVRVPVIAVQAHLVAPGDVLRARDAEGVWWVPVKTSGGWYRRRA